MKYPLSVLLISFLLMSCGGKKESNNVIASHDEIVTIDLVNNLDQASTEHLLSDAVENIDIVSLEMTDKSLIGDIQDVIVDDNNIFIVDYRSGISRFNREGVFLNNVGKKGHGPGEYNYIKNIQLDSGKQLVYLYDSVEDVIFKYNYDGTFVTTVCRGLNDIVSGLNSKIALVGNSFFLIDILPVLYERDIYWTLALFDDDFKIKHKYINPDFIGKEAAITENKGVPIGWKNYWVESYPLMNFYNDNLMMSYSKGDTIYEYDEEKELFLPKYSLQMGKQPTFDESHKWIKDRQYFTYLSLYDFYVTKDYIYFQLAKEDVIYIAKYDKSKGDISCQQNKTVLKEQKLPGSPGFVYRSIVSNFLLKNDLCGGLFDLEYESFGKYWLTVITPERISKLDIEKIKNEPVKNETLKNKYLDILSNMKEDDNPVLVIATLK